jgi:beta-lactamase superfamily II metal-dependent hydrolase
MVERAADITVGTDNRFEHPLSEVLKRLKEARVYCIDPDESVAVASAGRRLWLTCMVDIEG